ncbi:MAG: phosphoadenylyl-sulfate reductase [Roseobacter sp.]
MPLDTPSHHLAQKTPPGGSVDAGLTALVSELNQEMRHHSATDVIRTALAKITPLSLVTSFGAESVALLHLTAMVDRNIPVLFVDTEMMFTETLVYQQEVAERLGLRNLRILRSAHIAQQDPDGTLHKTNPDRCCNLRKTEPLQSALSGSNGWLTGRKRFQSGTRAHLEFFEVESETGRIKVNPLAYWAAEDVAEYIAENRLPRHPLVAQGFPSIGCAPCTSPVQEGEDIRAGRWRETAKDECGIHFENGTAVRTGDLQ